MINDYILTIVLAIIQGLTEFLPISSSGHLLLLHQLTSAGESSLAFDVALHVGTLVALIIVFWKDIVVLLKGVGDHVARRSTDASRLVLMVFVGTIPAALAGFFLEDVIERFFRNTLVVATMLFVVGILFFVGERFGKRLHTIDRITVRNALLIGCAQALALIPGTSRSGITIIAGLFSGLQRKEAVRFSFILSIPIIAGAAGKTLITSSAQLLAADELRYVMLGIVVSCIVGLATIKFLLRFTEKYSLRVFGWYRIVLSGIIIISLVV